MESVIESLGSDLVEYVLLDLELGNLQELRAAFGELNAAELAHILESLPPDRRMRVWELIGPEVHGDVLSYMHDEARGSIIEAMPDHAVVAAVGELDAEDLADVLEILPEELGDSIVDQLEEEHRSRLEVVRPDGR